MKKIAGVHGLAVVEQCRLEHLVVQLVEEGAEEDEGVVLSTDLCKTPALPHGHATIRCIIPQPCTHPQTPCWPAVSNVELFLTSEKTTLVDVTQEKLTVNPSFPVDF